MRNRLAPLAVLPVLVLAVLAGTVIGARSEANAAQDVQPLMVPVIAEDFRFVPSDMTVRANQPIRFVFMNNGAERHRLNVGGFDDRWRSEDPGPGDMTTLDAVFTQPGVYEVWCSSVTDAGNHRALGMEGTLTVVE
jgi:plastocyanin